MRVITVGVLALQGGFAEHLHSLQRAAADNTTNTKQQPLLPLRSGAEGSPVTVTSSPMPGPGPGSTLGTSSAKFTFVEVRTPQQLALCEALVIPGGESTTLSLVAAQSGLLEPLREFVKVFKRPTWGTCAGLIMLSEEASSTKRDGQELIGGLDVRVHRNHFGRQIESFVTDLDLPFLSAGGDGSEPPFPAVFIRAPVVESLLPDSGSNKENAGKDGAKLSVEVLAVLPGRHANNERKALAMQLESLPGEEMKVPAEGLGDIVALRQGNVFGMSFHPELTDDVRIHRWWLEQVEKAILGRS